MATSKPRWPNLPARNREPRTTSDLHLTWTVPYQPGPLKAVGRKAGEIVLGQELVTTGQPAAVDLFVDRPVIAADRRDVAYVTFQIVNAQGRVVPTACNEVSFEIQRLTSER